MRNRSGSLLIVASLVVAAALNSRSFGAPPLLSALQVDGATTSDNVVRVVVSNPASTTQVYTVTVTAVVDGALVTSTATQSVPAGASATVSVHASGVPVSITTTVPGITDSPDGAGW